MTDSGVAQLEERRIHVPEVAGSGPAAATMEAVIDRLRRMTPDEIFESSVRSGIHLPNGELAPEYGGALTRA